MVDPMEDLPGEEQKVRCTECEWVGDMEETIQIPHPNVVWKSVRCPKCEEKVEWV